MLCFTHYVCSLSEYCIFCGLHLIFFFFKQKTAYEMRISDWSSDVCSSDLAHLHDRGKSGELRARRHAFGTVRVACRFLANTRKASEALLFGYLLYIAWIALASNEGEAMKAIFIRHGESTGNAGMQIGRASCRERVGQYV